MDALDAILNRSSAAKLVEPGPTGQQLDTILTAGQSAPDHGRLQPWRFVIIEGDARNVLANTMAGLRLAKFPDSPQEALAQERAKAFRAPTIIAIAAAVTEGKIPAIEQVMAVAAATQNMFLAAFAMGLGAMWKTGGAAYDESFKVALGLAQATRSSPSCIWVPAWIHANRCPKRPRNVVSRLAG